MSLSDTTELLPTDASLPLDATPLECLKHISRWHIEFAKNHSSSFRQLLDIISMLGSSFGFGHVSLRVFNQTINLLSPVDRLQFHEQLKTLAYMPSDTPIGGLLKSYESHETQADDQVDIGEVYEREQKALIENEAPLIQHLRLAIQNLKKQPHKDVINHRLGLPGFEHQTLDVCGKMLGISRERVRQIEKMVLERLEKLAFWDDVFRDKVDRQFENQGLLVSCTDLEANEPWFKDFILPTEGLRIFLKYFAPDLTVFAPKDEVYLVRKSLLEPIDNLVRDLKTLWSREMDQDAVDDQALAFCKEWEAPPGIFIDIVRKYTTTRVTKEAAARNFINLASEPFTKEECIAHCIQLGVDMGNQRGFENIIQRHATPVLKNPTRYASLPILGLSGLQHTKYLTALYDFWLTKHSEERVFHGDEIMAWASGEGLAYQHHWSNWWAVAPLSFDPLERFQVNKLVVWLRDAYPNSPPPTKLSLVKEVLKRSGEPMSYKKIISEIDHLVGVGNGFQIHPDGDIEIVSKGFFKYVGR